MFEVVGLFVTVGVALFVLTILSAVGAGAVVSLVAGVRVRVRGARARAIAGQFIALPRFIPTYRGPVPVVLDTATREYLPTRSFTDALDLCDALNRHPSRRGGFYTVDGHTQWRTDLEEVTS